MQNIYSYIKKGLKEKKNLVIATIIDTKGSVPQIPGSSALICEGDIWKGTLGGGIMESEVQQVAKKSGQTNSPVLYEFNLDADIGSSDGAICGGKATILIDADPEKHAHVFSALNKSLDRKIPGVLITIIHKPENKPLSIERNWSTGINDPKESQFKNFNITSEIKDVLKDRKTRLVRATADQSHPEPAETHIFLEPVFPLPKLVIVGAGHIGQAVAHLGTLLEFEVWVIDDRPEFANRNRFPDSDHIIVEEIGTAMKKLSITSDSYIVIVTRGHAHDADALKPCIGSNAAYIGMIGSSRKVKQMREEFIKNEWATPEQYDSVYAPIGIDISSVTIQEIAVSIAAQLVRVRSDTRKRKKRPAIRSIILAAGESKRMKEPKLLMPYQGKTIIETVVENVNQSRVDEILVVLGAWKEEIRNRLQNHPVTFCINDNYTDGMISSIQTGVNSITGSDGACLVFLGDQPMIPSAVIDQIIDNYHLTGKGIVQPKYQNKKGHPVLIDMKYKEEINKLDQEIGLRELIRKFPDDMVEVNVDNPGILRDIDTLDDYKNEIAKIN
ncbi:MAG: XdhC family protein [Bacteroidales bacterium]|nr:MAG: XdhC family protein [Bacteroidales bacterium]